MPTNTCLGLKTGGLLGIIGLLLPDE